MQITVDLPDDIARHADPGREALERLAIEARPGRLKSRLQPRLDAPQEEEDNARPHTLLVK
jgi:hypothetical protein